ncbi:hypothetical protein G9A89_003056 [Geosiphon pyriformis]|nr:hypothetical protein G9A89_003056 [Geosiphon pyriformis]
MDFSDQILKLSKQLFETIQKSPAQIEITIDKKEIWYKDKSRRREDESSIKTKRSLFYPPPERQCWRKNCLRAEGREERGKEQKKGYKRRYLVPELKEIKEALAHETELPETKEWTPDNAQEWKEKLFPAYWFYKIGEQLDLKTPYEDFSQKTFNKKAIQQVEKFIGKNNLTLYYKTAYQLYVAFQHCPNILLYGLIKTITFTRNTAVVIWALKHFQQYLKNRKEFNIITDNIGLKWLNKKKTEQSAKQF